jgi:AcrR family transcriptional regulator
MLGEEGCERIMLKSISDACSISTQTLHNSFGSKVELLTAAMNQYTLMMDSRALAQAADPSVFLWLGLAYCQVATEHPEFMREFVHATFSPKLTLREALIRYGTDLKLQILRSLANRELIRPFIDTRMAAEQIACVNTFAMLEWAENGDIRKLYERMIHGNGSILLGILTPDAGKDIESWLSGQFSPMALMQGAMHDRPKTMAMLS